MLFGDPSVSTMLWQHKRSHFNMFLPKTCLHKKHRCCFPKNNVAGAPPIVPPSKRTKPLGSYCLHWNIFWICACIPDFDLLRHLPATTVFKIIWGSRNQNMPSVELTLPTCNFCGTGLVKDWPGHCGPVACKERNQTKWASTFWTRVSFHWTQQAKTVQYNIETEVFTTMINRQTKILTTFAWVWWRNHAAATVPKNRHTIINMLIGPHNQAWTSNGTWTAISNCDVQRFGVDDTCCKTNEIAAKVCRNRRENICFECPPTTLPNACERNFI